MADLSLPWSADFSLSSTAGLAVADGAAETEQRLIRRLLTNPGDYAFDPAYGAGLGQYVGRPVDAAGLSALISEQALLEAAVASVTSVTVAQDGLGSVAATIVYTAADGSERTAFVSA